MNTQAIGPATSAPLPPGAINALGGAPIPMPSIPGLELPAKTEAPAPPPAPTGNPTFDSIPPELALRRSKVETARRLLADLISRIQADATAIRPILDDLENDAAALKSGELFDPAAAGAFLSALTAVITGLTPKPATKSKEKTAPVPEA